MAKNKKIEVQGTEISIYKGDPEDSISMTDIARHKNPDFKPVEFDGFRKQAGLNSFVLTPKRWIETTNAIAITQMTSLLNHANLKKLK